MNTREQVEASCISDINHMADMDLAKEHFVDSCMQSIAFADIQRAIDLCPYKDEFIATVMRQNTTEDATGELIETLEEIMRDFFTKRFIGRMR